MKIECPKCVQSSGYVIVHKAGEMPYYDLCLECDGTGMVELENIDSAPVAAFLDVIAH